MPFFFFYLILLSCNLVEYSLTINDTDYIRCTSRCSQIIVSFSQPLVFPSECQENNNMNNYIDAALACGIEYRLDYDTQKIYIDFQASNYTGSLEDQRPGEVLVQTIWLGLSQNITQANVLTRKYSCNTNNDCARKFYFNTVEYLANEAPRQFDTIKNKLHNDSLIIGEESLRRCIDSDRTGSKPSIKCKMGLCSAEFETYPANEQQNRKVQKCDYEIRPYLFSEVEHYVPKSPAKEREVLRYKCNKNVCNRDAVLDNLRLLVGEVASTTSKSPPLNIITDKKQNFALKETIASSSLLILFLFLIQLFI